MIAALLLAIAASCPVVTLPANSDHDDICVDCNTHVEVACAHPTKRAVTALTLRRSVKYGAKYIVESQRDDGTFRAFYCDVTYEQFIDIKLGDSWPCAAGWRR